MHDKRTLLSSTAKMKNVDVERKLMVEGWLKVGGEIAEIDYGD